MFHAQSATHSRDVCFVVFRGDIWTLEQTTGCLLYQPPYTLITRFMGPTWGPSGSDRTQVGPMLAPWILLSRYIYCVILNFTCTQGWKRTHGIGKQPTFWKKWCKRFPWEIISQSELSGIIEWNKPLGVVFQEYSVLIFFKTRLKIPYPLSCTGIWNFTTNILYLLRSSIARFDMFRHIYTQETYRS